MIALLSFVTDWYELLVYSLIAIITIYTLDKLGKGVVLRELIALHGVLICLVMPLVGYHVYTNQSHIARLWVRYMPVPETEYFSYALPAISTFVLVLCWPVNRKHAADEGYLLNGAIMKAKQVLRKKVLLGPRLAIIGLVSMVVSRFLPVSLQFFAILLFWASFSGILYAFFTDNLPRRKLIIAAFFSVVVIQALQSGMFTIVAYMGMTMFSFFFLGKRIAFWKKLAVFLMAGLFLILVQSVKSTYRTYTWVNNYQGSKAELFTDLLVNKISNGTDIFSKDAFFPIYFRANQGFNVALVMRRVPRVQPFDNGKELGLSAAASLVPRFLWPDKPEAGGKYNMKYYTGLVIKGWSTDVGPLGEAYGSFGHSGGIIFMCLLGILIRWAYRKVFVIARKMPLLIFWIPVLFYQVTYSMETDTLQILNSLVKASFAVWLLYKLFPILFGNFKKTKERQNAPLRQHAPTVEPEY